MTFAEVKEVCRAIVGDTGQQWMTDAYLNPIVNHVYRLQILYLSDTCSPYIVKVATAPGLDIGTTDLSKYQATKDQPLFGLFNPYKLDWKLAGLPDNYYRQAREWDVLPDVAPQTQGLNTPWWTLGWEWRAWIVYITPPGVSLDVRVRGEFIPPPLLNEEDVVAVHPLLGDVLAEDSAACANRERANPGQMQAFQLGATLPLDNIANQLVRSQQGTTVRVGRMSRGNNARGWNGWGSWGGG